MARLKLLRHLFTRWNAVVKTHRNTCGSEPAREGAVSVSIFFLAHRFREQARSHRGYPQADRSSQTGTERCLLHIYARQTGIALCRTPPSV